ncbi:MAG: class I SAM-dependent methyltransferase [Pseudonocardiales bacterium]|nr:class I SAM-dependent methyltransferase [Pseudonocardiales bacterium]MBW0010653.1 class I SAM-dependent methyltransferase [Pseudonocardiales bacterium]
MPGDPLSALGSPVADAEQAINRAANARRPWYMNVQRRRLGYRETPASRAKWMRHMEPNTDTAYDASTSADFAEVDDRVGWVLGYPFALRALGVGGPDAPVTLLDYGCGPGKVAHRVARDHGLRVIAVDPSAEMLSIASRRHGHPRVVYHRVREHRLAFLADSSVDAAMACFVFLALPSLEQVRAIAAEVWRVLRPGGRFVILDPHSDHVGMQFSAFRSGEPGVSYQDGDPRVAHLLMTNGEWLELPDYFWSAHTYQEILAEVGFTDLRTDAPVLADAERPGPADPRTWDYDVEREHAPFMLVHGCRPGS